MALALAGAPQRPGTSPQPSSMPHVGAGGLSQLLKCKIPSLVSELEI